MITATDLKYLRVAEAMSYLSDWHRVSIGACVVNKRTIVSVGRNKNRTHPEQLKYNYLLEYEIKMPKLHAELDALIRAGEESKGSTLYVFRKGRDGILRNCKPCAACMGKITDSGVKRIVYTVYEGIKEMRVS